MLQIVSTIREFREFLDAKKRKREPIRWSAKAGACASYRPRDRQGFERFCRSLIGVTDWGRASERLEALAHALRARHQCALPLPRKVLQNEDRSLTIFWEGATVRCFEDGFVSIIGGADGVKAKQVTNELLDLLAFASRIQAAS